MTISALDDLPPAIAKGATPRRIFREQVARERLHAIARMCHIAARPPLRIIAGYSFKTNPRAELVGIAHDAGFFAEVISAPELEWARRAGFDPARTIYNGPEPVPAQAAGAPLRFVFADSREAFARNAALGVARTLGVRLRPSMIASRFGVPVDEDEALCRMVDALPQGTPVGVSFHARRGDFNGAGWRDVADDVLDRAVAMQARTGHAIAAFDVGGGWTPEQFDADFLSDMRWLIDRVVDELPACTDVLVEPGQAACTPAEALLTRVLEVRERPGRREAIVDAAYSDWPLMHAYVHGFYVRRDDRWMPLGRGGDRLGGRTCLEYDLIDGIRLPDDLAAGDLLLITDTGSYDHSMAFSFAEGAR